MKGRKRLLPKSDQSQHIYSNLLAHSIKTEMSSIKKSATLHALPLSSSSNRGKTFCGGTDNEKHFFHFKDAQFFIRSQPFNVALDIPDTYTHSDFVIFLFKMWEQTNRTTLKGCGIPLAPFCHQQHSTLSLKTCRKVVENPQHQDHGFHPRHFPRCGIINWFHTRWCQRYILPSMGKNGTYCRTCGPRHHLSHER